MACSGKFLSDFYVLIVLQHLYLNGMNIGVAWLFQQDLSDEDVSVVCGRLGLDRSVCSDDVLKSVLTLCVFGWTLKR